jgi:integrator complex subunit 6
LTGAPFCSVDQIIQKLKAGAVIKFKCEIGEGDEIPFSRNTITTFSGKEYNWPIPESFWLDRNSNSLPPREAQPTLTFRRTVENAVESATSHMLLDTLKFPADTYMIDNSTNPTPPRGQRWMVYVAGSRGEGRLGDPIGFIRASPAGSTTAGSGNNLLVLLPYNYPTLFGLIVEAARVFQASGQNINSPTGVWAFQPKAMPSSWRESFNAYVTGCPIYYYAPLKKVLRKYNLQDLIPDVQDSGRSYQLSNMLNRLREQSITESESSNKTNARPLIRLDSSGGVSISTSTKAPSRSSSAVAEASPSASPLHSRNDKDVTSSFAMDSMVMNIATMSLKELLQSHQRSKKHVFDHQGSQNQGLHLLPSPPVTSSLLTPIPKRFENLKRSSDSATISEVTLKLAPSWRAKDEDEKHYQPIDTMSDYESRLIKKEALRNPLGEPEPDEDTPMGLRRRQLCFNLGNPYKKSASKVCPYI